MLNLVGLGWIVALDSDVGFLLPDLPPSKTDGTAEKFSEAQAQILLTDFSLV